jgi:mRNA interferase MazF
MDGSWCTCRTAARLRSHSRCRVAVRNAVTCAPTARTIRGINSGAEVGPDEGRPESCVINCDKVPTVPIEDLDEAPVGFLNQIKRSQLDRAPSYARDIVY